MVLVRLFWGLSCHKMTISYKKTAISYKKEPLFCLMRYNIRLFRQEASHKKRTGICTDPQHSSRSTNVTSWAFSNLLCQRHYTSSSTTHLRSSAGTVLYSSAPDPIRRYTFLIPACMIILEHNGQGFAS